MKRLALLCILFLPLATWAQRQYYLPAAGASGEEKDKPMIEVYLPKETNGSCVPSVARFCANFQILHRKNRTF
jgi:hypothetical protein